MIVGAIFVALSITPFEAVNASSTRVWFGGEDPVTVRDKHRTLPADFMALFAPDAPWQHAAAGVSAFKISMQFATGASDADLATVIHELDRRQIALTLETGMLRNDRGCGKGEGYIPQDLLMRAMTRIQKLGGELAYVAMDEVVFFGREKSWPDQPNQVSCKDTVGELVQEVTANAALIHHYFPHAKIGAVEPITTGHDIEIKHLLEDYMTFADRYRDTTGVNLAFFHVDIAWRSKNWQSGIAPLKAAVKSRGIPFGIIIGGNPDYSDEVAWTNAGLTELKLLTADPATAPDEVIIQSWQPLPTRYLPETMAGTSTWMLLQAEQMR